MGMKLLRLLARAIYRARLRGRPTTGRTSVIRYPDGSVVPLPRITR